MDLITLAKIAGPVSSGVFAGYTWALTDATIPSVLAAQDEATKARQWRVQFIQGFLLSGPCTLINLASWTYLAINSSAETRARPLFVLAALGTGSGTVFAWTFLRATNGALSIRAQKLAGDWHGYFTIPLTYSRSERKSIDLEKKATTDQLIQGWANLNLVRSVILIGGTIAGVVGLVVF